MNRTNEILRQRGLLRGLDTEAALSRALDERNQMAVMLGRIYNEAFATQLYDDGGYELLALALESRSLLEAADEYEWTHDPDVGQFENEAS